MGNNVNLDEIKNWLLKKIAGTITEEEETLLQEWIRKSPRNKALADRVFSEDFLTSAIITDDNRTYTDTSWRKLAYRIGYYRLFPLAKWVAAAVLIGSIILGGYFLSRDRENTVVAGSSKAILYDIAPATVYPLTEVEGKVLDYARYIARIPAKRNVELSPDLRRTIMVPYGGEYQILLEDSTLIHLGPGSSLSVPVDYSSTNRAVSLSGEAYLVVHKDSLHPFTVQTKNVEVRVLGTRLNIEAYEDDEYTRITLERGRAELKTVRGVRNLPVGHVATILDDDKSLRISRTNLYESTAWHRGRFVFDNQPLGTIMKKLSRWYDVEVSFSDTRLRDLYLTMDVNKYDTFNKLADAMKIMNEIQIQIEKGNKVLISEKSLN